jgi:hypothetical protein
MPPARRHGANALMALVHSQQVLKSHHMQNAHRHGSASAPAMLFVLEGA